MAQCGGATGGGPVGPNANTRMQDGRHFTDYRPRGDLVALGTTTGSSFQLKDQLMRNAEGLMARDRTAAADEVGGAGWADSAAALPGFETMADCNTNSCAYLAAAAPFEGGATGIGRS